MSSYNQQQEIHVRLEAVQRQVSHLIACGIIGSFFVFMAGYYAGKKCVIEEYNTIIVTDSFTDMLYSTFCSAREMFIPYSSNSSQEELLTPLDQKVAILMQAEGEQSSYAEIGNYSTSKEATAWCNKLLTEGYKAVVIPCKSETSRGVFYEWFQVRIYQDRAYAAFSKICDILERKYRISKKIRIQQAGNTVHTERGIV